MSIYFKIKNCFRGDQQIRMGKPKKLLSKANYEIKKLT